MVKETVMGWCQSPVKYYIYRRTRRYRLPTSGRKGNWISTLWWPCVCPWLYLVLSVYQKSPLHPRFPGGLSENVAFIGSPYDFEWYQIEPVLVPGSMERGSPEEEGDKRWLLWLVILSQALLTNISPKLTGHATDNLWELSLEWGQEGMRVRLTLENLGSKSKVFFFFKI